MFTGKIDKRYRDISSTIILKSRILSLILKLLNNTTNNSIVEIF